MAHQSETGNENSYRPRKTRRDRQKRTVRQELKEKASWLGLPTGNRVLPERRESQSYGDPTAVDDRPFVLGI